MSMLRAMHKDRITQPPGTARRAVCLTACLSATLWLGACATRLDQAPVVDRSGALSSPLSTNPSANAMGAGAMSAPAAPLPPAPPGFYRVKPGDTLYHIALVNGQNFRDVATWNNITNPNQIEVDQLLRVAPPPPGSMPSAPPAAAAAGAGGVPPLSSGPNQPPIYGGGTATPAPVAPSAPAAAAGDNGAPSNVSFAWPVRGPVLSGFDDAKNKGLDIGGTAGTPVRASADGRVVYAGNGLRGYGNLIIIKHDATYLTAYAHNRSLMVKEGDAVTKGQKIAEMGDSDSQRVLLHFEVRRQGKPVDPMKYLPPQ